MNTHLKSALLKQRTRNNFRKIAKNSVNESNLYTTFVEPFTDIVKAAGLSAQDVVSSLSLVAGTILTLSPKKQAERMANFKDRQQKIAEKWKPLMDKAAAGLSTGDADIIAFTFAPGIYFASSLGSKAYNAAAGIGSFLDSAGIKSSLTSMLPGVSAPAPYKPEKDEKSLLDKLNTLFLGTAVGMSAYAGFKQSQKSEGATRKMITLTESANFIDDFNEFLDDSGLDTEIEKTQKDFIDHYETVIQTFDKILADKTILVNAVKEADNYTDFMKSLDQIDRSGVEITNEINKVKDAVEDGVKKLKNKESFVKKLNNDNKSKKDMSPEEIDVAASNIVFANIKTDLDKQLASAVNDLKATLASDLEDILPTSKSLQIIKKAKSGIKLYNMIQAAKNRYSIS